MVPGYNTNGFAHHRLEDAVGLLAETGYRAVALTMDYHALDPFSPMYPTQVEAVWTLLQRHDLRCVVETGARFLLDPRRKHQPTLLDADEGRRARRADFLRRAVDLASVLGADAVSLWSGTCPDETSADILLDRLVAECKALCEYAVSRNVRLAFEPEPGMFVETMGDYERLFDRVSHPAFGLTLDVGHLYVTGETPVTPHVLRWKDVLWNVHVEDMRRGVHDHLMFGEGDMDFGEVFAGLRAADYRGGLFVELSRHSHDAVRTAAAAMAFLRRYQ